jgi:serine/threonine protein kinase
MAAPEDPLHSNRPSELIHFALQTPALTVGLNHWTPPTPDDLQALLSGYHVLAFIARGGMGAVYRGVQVSLGRAVAIKILPPELSDSDRYFAERFKREARAMAQLNHPGIVSVHDFGELPDGMLFYVMEFIDGTDVAQLLAQQGRLSSAHAMAITAHVCDALHYAHERGVVHRDIKPANIMVGHDGRVKVADFGLAKDSSTAGSGFTGSGMLLGTAHFIAPEALTPGVVVDHRADIYAVGVSLYQMLTGKLPQGLFDMPSLQVPGLDPRYDQIIAQALRESRDQRYQSVLDMRLALDGILTSPVQRVDAAGEGQPVLPNHAKRQKHGDQGSTSSNSSHWKGIMVLGIALLMIAVVAFLIRNFSPPINPVVPQPLKKAEPTPKLVAQQPYSNSLGMKFVPVPGTKVMFCVHETRRQDFAGYAADNRTTAPKAWQSVSWEGKPVSNEPDHPVVKINWYDAHDFCAWLSKKENLHYRLPTDREWSIAVGLKKMEREGVFPGVLSERITNEFPWGQVWPPPPAVGNYEDEQWLRQLPGSTTDGYATTSPVMKFAPNALGLYDLGGNVWEWVEDLWDDRRVGRVLRGSSWFDFSARYLYSSRRLFIDPDYRGDHYGFRCVLEKPAEQQAAHPSRP